jgi:hypothetical protein
LQAERARHRLVGGAPVIGRPGLHAEQLEDRQRTGVEIRVAEAAALLLDGIAQARDHVDLRAEREVHVREGGIGLRPSAHVLGRPGPDRRLRRARGNAHRAQQRVPIDLPLDRPGQGTAHLQLLVGEEAAQHHIGVQRLDLAVQRQLLREEAAVEALEIAEDVGAGEIRVHVALIDGEAAQRGDRLQRAVADADIDQRGAAVILDRLAPVAVQRLLPVGRLGRGHLETQRRSEGVDQRLGRPGLEAGRRVAAIAAALGIVADQPDREVRRRLEHQLRLHRLRGVAVEVAAGLRVGVETVAGRSEAGDAERQRIGHRQIGRTADQHRVEVAVVHLDQPADPVGRLGRGEQQGARGRVLPEQGPLRTAQHLEVVDVEEVLERRRRARAVDPVDEDADRSFEAAAVPRRPQAADDDVRGGGGDIGRAEGDRRTDRLDVGDVVDPRLRQHIRARRGDGDRHVLQVLAAALRGDDDVAQPLRMVGRRILAAALGRGVGDGAARGAGRHVLRLSRARETNPGNRGQ